MSAGRLALAAPLIGATALLLGSGGGATRLASTSHAPARHASTSGAAGCAPAALDAPSTLPGTQVRVSPEPGSLDALPQTQISFVGAAPGQVGVLAASGSRSGAHSGRLAPYSQNDGASFIPSKPFAPGETVTVSASIGGGQPVSYSFTVASPNAIPPTPETASGSSPARAFQRFRSRPDLRPPTVTVTTHAAGADPGDVFVAPYLGPGQTGPMILDGSGAVVWFKPLSGINNATNFAVQRYRGAPVLTWWQGNIISHGFGLGEDVIADSHYQTIATVKAGNGVQADLHDFQITPAGTALLTAYKSIACDLTAVGGPARGAVTDSVLQEIDIATGLVRNEWDSLNHVGLGESYQSARNGNSAWPDDFFHINSVDVQSDGTLLVSARNTWASYDIDPGTGRILWRLGGKQSTFALGPGVATAWQHDIRQLGAGSFSLFDNGASPKVHPESRGMVVSIDPQARSATLQRQFTHAPALVAPSQGNFQALANGNWFAGWGQVPYFSEFSPSGQLVFDAHFPATDQSYRSFRFSWATTPRQAPAIAVRSRGGGTVVAYASWNGATGVSKWRVLAGSSPRRLAPTDAIAARSGFETAITARTRQHYIAVVALDAAGHVLATSRAAHR